MSSKITQKYRSYLVLIAALPFTLSINAETYRIVDTGQVIFYDNQTEITAPVSGESFYGQDAHFPGNQPDYTDNGDGTITDNVTGLMWQQSADLNDDGEINIDDKLSHNEALVGANTYSLAGYDDWRLPTIKESYSLFMFTGEDPSGYDGTDTDDLIPFINTDYFDIDYGDTDAGERIIDAQFVSSTVYVSTTMNGDSTMFGVNFVDGRIKGYPMGPMPGQVEDKQFYVLYVRDNIAYGQNEFVDNDDNTVSDNATGLMWQQGDSEIGLDWESALEYAQIKNSENYLGYNDWRVPDSKELHSIVDYTRAPAVSSSAAIDPIFDCSTIIDEGGEDNYPFYWSSTTHANMQNGAWGAYLCFGEALGWMPDPFPPFNVTLLDVHGAGAQRSDPKSGNADDYPEGHGPQGDVVRIDNYIKLVRDISTATGLDNNQSSDGTPQTISLNQNYPNPFNPSTTITYSLSNKSYISIDIYDARGCKVTNLVQARQAAGIHDVIWSGTNSANSPVSTGVYFAVVKADNHTSVLKMTFLR